MASPLPDWIFELQPLSNVVGPLVEFGRDPVGYVREILVNVVLAGVAAFTFSTIGIIDRAFEAATAPLGTAGDAVIGSVSAAGGAVVGAVQTLVAGVAAGVASQLGIAAFPVTVALYALLVALFIRALPPALAAGSDALGSVPVVGSLLDAGATFAQRYIGGGS